MDNDLSVRYKSGLCSILVVWGGKGGCFVPSVFLLKIKPIECMSVSEVVSLRKAGRLEEAYEVAYRECSETPNECTYMSLFWVLHDFVKSGYAPDQNGAYLDKMKELLPVMRDDNGFGARAYRNMRLILLPNAGVVMEAFELSKRVPDAAYQRISAFLGPGASPLDDSLHEAAGWILYRYMKHAGGRLPSVKIRGLLRDYMMLHNARPSMLHSTVLNFALNFSKNNADFNFHKFFQMWGIGNLRQEDYAKGEVGGRVYPSLASKVAKKCFGIIKEIPRQSKSKDSLQWLKELYENVCRHEPDDDWAVRDYAAVCVWCDEADKAVALYRSLLSHLGNRYFLWAELACLMPDDTDLCIGFLLKAKEVERNEDFLGDVHLHLASLWLKKGCGAIAQKELEAYARHRKAKGWGMPGRYNTLKSTADAGGGEMPHVDYGGYVGRAEDFVFSDFDRIDFVVTKKWTAGGVGRCGFFDGKETYFSLKTNRFPILKRAKEGDIIQFRCRVEADCGKESLSGTAAAKRVVPMMARKTDKAAWSILPVRFGVVDYVNKSKRVIHIITQDSAVAFLKYEAVPFPINSFVKFRQYDDVRKDGPRTCVVCAEPCLPEEALPHMPCNVFRVDNVNDGKSLFHMAMKVGGFGGIVHYGKTDLRPAVGDRLWVTYCVKKGKDGKIQMKFLDIRPADAGGGV